MAALRITHVLADFERVAPAPPRLRLVPRAERLNGAEQQAVRIGRGDAFRYGWDAGRARGPWQRRCATLLLRLTGLRPVTPLADPRLERLRLFACMMRRDDRGAEAMAAELLADGMSSDALHHAIALALG